MIDPKKAYIFTATESRFFSGGFLREAESGELVMVVKSKSDLPEYIFTALSKVQINPGQRVLIPAQATRPSLHVPGWDVPASGAIFNPALRAHAGHLAPPSSPAIPPAPAPAQNAGMSRVLDLGMSKK